MGSLIIGGSVGYISACGLSALIPSGLSSLVTTAVTVGCPIIFGGIAFLVSAVCLEEMFQTKEEFKPFKDALSGLDVDTLKDGI